MSTAPARKAADPTVVLLVCVTVIICFVLACVVIVFVAAPDGANTGSLVALLVAQLAPTIAAVAALSQLRRVASTAADTAADVERLANGVGDAKFRAAVADVVDPAYHAPGIDAQIEQDRQTAADSHRVVVERRRDA